MSTGIIFAIIAAAAFGSITVFQKLAANYVYYFFGALLISITAIVIEICFLIPRFRNITLVSNPKGIIFAIAAGACATVIDVASIKAYSSGLPVSIGGPIILGGSVAVAAVIGLFLGESLSLLKFLGLILIIAGSVILGGISK